MKSSDVRRKYIEFFKKRGHVEIPAANLVPENDPTTLFTSSGMQPLIPYLLGQPHPLGKRLVNSQKAFRASDIDEVGDNRHTTFFEMLGNWSLGDYFKKEQLPWIFEFLTKELDLEPKRLYVSVFEGDKKLKVERKGRIKQSLTPDVESISIWKQIFSEVGIEAKEGERIFLYPAKKNWWSRSGEPELMPPGEPGGPDSEVFYDYGANFKFHEHSQWAKEKCHPNCECGRFMEIANSVFMQYQKGEDGSFKELAQRNVDFGGGLERLVSATNNNPDVFTTDIFLSLIKEVENKLFKKFKYDDSNVQRSFRILADHIRAIVFMLTEGIVPSNKAQGYIMRRLLRRAIVQKFKWGDHNSHISSLIDIVVLSYQDYYPEIKKALRLKNVITEEEDKFFIVYKKAHKDWTNLLLSRSSGTGPWGTVPFGEGPKYVPLSPEEVFKFITSYGLPLEIIRDEIKWTGDYKRLEDLLNQHKKLSQTAAQGMFKGGLADHSEETTKLHTATHLLHQALRTILGTHVQQKGSNITQERLRFDFTHPDKMTADQLKSVQTLVNQQIAKNLAVTHEVMNTSEALKSGALGFFGEKYGDKVKVYTIGPFSREICGGPHVAFTGTLGHFTIKKEESAGAGIRRIYGIITHYGAAQHHSTTSQT